MTMIGRRPVDNVGEVNIQAETDQNRLIQHTVVGKKKDIIT